MKMDNVFMFYSEYKRKGFIIRPDPNVPEGRGTIIDRREMEEF